MVPITYMTFKYFGALSSQMIRALLRSNNRRYCNSMNTFIKVIQLYFIQLCFMSAQNVLLNHLKRSRLKPKLYYKCLNKPYNWFLKSSSLFGLKS